MVLWSLVSGRRISLYLGLVGEGFPYIGGQWNRLLRLLDRLSVGEGSS